MRSNSRYSWKGTFHPWITTDLYFVNSIRFSRFCHKLTKTITYFNERKGKWASNELRSDFENFDDQNCVYWQQCFYLFFLHSQLRTTPLRVWKVASVWFWWMLASCLTCLNELVLFFVFFDCYVDVRMDECVCVEIFQMQWEVPRMWLCGGVS